MYGNTVIIVNDVNTANEEPNAIGDSDLINENMSFNEEYVASISPIIMAIAPSYGAYLFESAEWSRHLIKTHPSASKIDMDEIYDVMSMLSITIGNQLKIESSSINKFSNIQKV